MNSKKFLLMAIISFPVAAFSQASEGSNKTAESTPIKTSYVKISDSLFPKPIGTVHAIGIPATQANLNSTLKPGGNHRSENNPTNGTQQHLMTISAVGIPNQPTKTEGK